MHGKNHLFKWMSGLPSGSQWGQQIFKIALETPYTVYTLYLNLFMFSRVNFSKVHTFWEGHKNVHISWISGELCPFSSQNLFTLCIMKNCLYKKLIRRTMWDLCTID